MLHIQIEHQLFNRNYGRLMYSASFRAIIRPSNAFGITGSPNSGFRGNGFLVFAIIWFKVNNGFFPIVQR